MLAGELHECIYADPRISETLVSVLVDDEKPSLLEQPPYEYCIVKHIGIHVSTIYIDDVIRGRGSRRSSI